MVIIEKLKCYSFYL